MLMLFSALPILPGAYGWIRRTLETPRKCGPSVQHYSKLEQLLTDLTTRLTQKHLITSWSAEIGGEMNLFCYPSLRQGSILYGIKKDYSRVYVSNCTQRLFVVKTMIQAWRLVFIDYHLNFVIRCNQHQTYECFGRSCSGLLGRVLEQVSNPKRFRTCDAYETSIIFTFPTPRQHSGRHC